MFNSVIMDKLEKLGFGCDIDAFESYFRELQDAAADGEPLVQDPVYDEYREILKAVRPESELLKNNWEKDSGEELKDYDELLKQYGMRSIRTCTTDDEIKHNFSKVLSELPVEVCSSFKLNGHASRVVFERGHLVSATTRGRSKKGRDITRHLKHILGEFNEYLEPYELVEIRGELIVTYADFNNKLKDKCKTPLSSVTSLVRDSVTDDELDMLHFVAYKIIIKDNTDMLPTLADEFEYLDSIGFEIPLYSVTTLTEFSDILNVRHGFEEVKKENKFPYDTDGIVMAINDDSEFYSEGLDGNAFFGNIAIKMGMWECNMYTSTITDIVWERGKSWFTPKAVVEPVVTAGGATVTTVPIYNVKVMNKLHLIPGEQIHFRFGGETGVQLLTAEGLSVTEI